jgi:hypothetical protein
MRDWLTYHDQILEQNSEMFVLKYCHCHGKGM